jgi:chromosome segregation ATPase
MNQLDSHVLELRSTVLNKDGYVDRRNREDEHIRREFETHRAISHRIDLNVVALRSDVDQMKKSGDLVHVDLEQIKSESCSVRVDISKLQATSTQIRTDLATLDHKMSRQFHDLNSRMRHSDRVRFNSLAHTILAPISPVPVITDDGALEWPQYFPRTVWKFWCLKKISRGTR